MRFDVYDDLKNEDKEWLKGVLNGTHESFIKHVEAHRDSKIKIKKEERKSKLYEGDVWIGNKSIELGLADKLGTYESVIYKDFPGVSPKDVTAKLE